VAIGPEHHGAKPVRMAFKHAAGDPQLFMRIKALWESGRIDVDADTGILVIK
jgi:hypothetical protein